MVKYRPKYIRAHITPIDIDQLYRVVYATVELQFDVGVEEIGCQVCMEGCKVASAMYQQGKSQDDAVAHGVRCIADLILTGEKRYPERVRDAAIGVMAQSGVRGREAGVSGES